MDKKFKISNLDWNIIIVTILLIVFGLTTIYSADNATSETGGFNSFYKQIIWFGLGLALASIIIAIPSRVLFDLAYLIYAFTLAVLIFVLIKPGSGETARWINFAGFTIQPSEFSKIAVVIALSRYLSLRKLNQNKLKDLIIAFVMIIIPLYLVQKQPDLGTSLVFIFLTIPMLFWAGVPTFTLFVLISPFISVLSSINFFFFLFWMLLVLLFLYLTKKPLIVLVGIFVINIGVGLVTPVLWNSLKPYQKDRLKIFLDPQQDAKGKGYQILQSQNAIGSGGVTGKGFMQGTQTQLRFLPEQNTDFIFSVLSEEFGFIGVSIALSLFLFLLIKMINIAVNARERFEGLIVIGFVSILLFHIFVNTGMTIGLMPITGLPLPFFSYGGSFLWTCMIMMGLTLNIANKKR